MVKPTLYRDSGTEKNIYIIGSEIRYKSKQKQKKNPPPKKKHGLYQRMFQMLYFPQLDCDSAGE